MVAERRNQVFANFPTMFHQILPSTPVGKKVRGIARAAKLYGSLTGKLVRQRQPRGIIWFAPASTSLRSSEEAIGCSRANVIVGQRLVNRSRSII